ncbi:hypothetical protein HYH02_004343 [Chlamydomonas schloesseri]|uniref:Ionotropic glutamate receptor C-terminal domain-containing protein n=1 Tax=Chlamydomonas schloesseri TaxID=2026947 RepID=A0A835WP53_9CHLO|nr:hypothetical protein HYH02_004343 [Chlamydomonas schloesseri]|eukprot:KAG2451075.1 hypothetical protein HYH02_004343 [Chlamydomonas schloesseri]
MEGDGFVRLSTSAPESVREAWRVMGEGDFLDVGSWLVGYNVDLLWDLQKHAAARGVTFNLTLGVVRPPGSAKDPRAWALNTASYDCVISSTQITPARSLIMDFMIPSIPFGYIVTTTTPQPESLSFSDRMTTFLMPFEPAVWGCIAGCIVVTGVVLYMMEESHKAEHEDSAAAGSAAKEEDEYADDDGCCEAGLAAATHNGRCSGASRSSRYTWRPAVGRVAVSVYRSFNAFVQYDAVHASTLAGRLYLMVFAFVSLLLVSAYTANLAAFFTRQGQPVQAITSINDFYKLNKAACIRNSSQAIAFMAKRYPGIRTVVVDSGQANLFDAVLSGRCVGAVNTDVHTRFILGSDDSFCDLQIVGQTLSLGYYAIPFRKSLANSTSGGGGSSSANPVVAAMNVLMADFIDAGEATDTASIHFPMDSDALCRAHAEAAAADSGGGSDLVSISLIDVGGLFILQGVAVVFCLVALAATKLSRRCRQQQQQRRLQRRRGAGGRTPEGGAGGEGGGALGLSPSLSRARSDMQLLGKHLKPLAIVPSGGGGGDGGGRGAVSSSSCGLAGDGGSSPAGFGAGGAGAGFDAECGGHSSSLTDGVPYTIMASESPLHPQRRHHTAAGHAGQVVVDVR